MIALCTIYVWAIIIQFARPHTIYPNVIAVIFGKLIDPVSVQVLTIIPILVLISVPVVS